MKKILLLSLFLLILSGCCDMNAVMSSWEGCHINEAIAQWGYPDYQQEIAGRTIYRWGDSGSMYIPQTSTTTGYISPYGTYHGTTYYSGGYNVNLSCVRTLEVNDNGYVVSWQWEGNNCDNSGWKNKKAAQNEREVEREYKQESDLIQAIIEGNLVSVKKAIAKGANPNTANGLIPLILASREGHKEIVKFLLDNGAVVNAKDPEGLTALFIASMAGNSDIVKLLIDKGADINVNRTFDDLTPLCLASLNGHIEVVKLLLEVKADVNTKAKNGDTPLSIAKANGHTQIVELLEKAGAK